MNNIIDLDKFREAKKQAEEDIADLDLDIFLLDLQMVLNNFVVF